MNHIEVPEGRVDVVADRVRHGQVEVGDSLGMVDIFWIPLERNAATSVARWRLRGLVDGDGGGGAGG